MGWFPRLLNMLTLGSDTPLRRLIAYYAVAIGLVVAVNLVFPEFDGRMSSAEITQEVDTPALLQDGLTTGPTPEPVQKAPKLQIIISVLMMLFGTIVLMLPVSWVYMSARDTRNHNQGVAQTLIILPIVVAGIVLIVQDSLALAFSLAGVVAAVRFRTTLRDARDTVYIFLAIAVGFAAGVESLTIGALLSGFFNFVVLITWRYDFGRPVLESASSAKWVEPLGNLAVNDLVAGVPDRDIMLALTPKAADALADRFDRVRQLVGNKKSGFNAVLRLTTDSIPETQRLVEASLDDIAKRWQLDQVVNYEGKPAELFYLVKIRKSMPREEFLTAIRAQAGGVISAANLEAGESLIQEENE